MKLKLGEVYKFFLHVGMMAMTLEHELKIGDIIHIQGEDTAVRREVDFIQIGHLPVRRARPGDNVGIKIDERVHPGDAVYKVIPQK